MQVIQHQELASSQASIVFNSIPQTMTDLYLVIQAKAVQTGTDEPDNLFLQVNSLTSGYSARNLTGMGGVVASYTNPNNITSKGYIGASASTLATGSPWSSTAVYIPNYAGNTSKSFSSDSVSEANSSTNYKTAISIAATLLSSTDAITSLTLTNASGANFAQYSSATLYGITKGSDGVTSVS